MEKNIWLRRKFILRILLLLLIIGGLAFYDVAYATESTIVFGDWKFELNGDGGLIVTEYCGEETELVIPSEVEGQKVVWIGESLFSGNTSIESVTIPDTVVRIGASAFFDSSIKKVVMPDSVTSIGDAAFEYCRVSDLELSDNLKIIGKEAFRYCGKLEAVYLSDTVEQIGHRAFEGCARLSNITVSEGNTVYASEEGVLFNKEMTELIQCPGKKSGEYQVPASVCVIDAYAFANCDVSRVSMSDTVCEIGEGAFRDCYSLTGIDLSSKLTEMGSYLFTNAKLLTDIDIPQDVTKIRSGAFAGTGLTAIELPEKVVEIESGAFSNCTALATVIVGENVTYIGEDAFEDSLWMTEQREKSGFVVLNGILIDATKCTGDVIVPNTVTIIGEAAFYGSEGLTSVTLPESVVLIDAYAFRYCNKLTSITLNSGLNKIGSCAFWGCSSLESIDIPETVTELGYRIFAGCYKLTDIAISSDIVEIDYHMFEDTKWLSDRRAESSLVIVNGTFLLDATTCEGDVCIPEGVTTIGTGALEHNSKMTSLVIPSTVTYISMYGPLAGTWSLTKIEVSERNSKYSSKDGVLYNKEGTILLACPGGITKYTVPEGVLGIEDFAFAQCGELEEVIVPDTVTTIGNSAFYMCNKLKKVVIPSSVTTIGDHIFANDEDVVLVTTAGSTAEKYAQLNDVKYELQSEANTGQEDSKQVESDNKNDTGKEESSENNNAPVENETNKDIVESDQETATTEVKVDVPKVSKVKSVKVSAGEKKLMITWKKYKGASGYQIQISTKKTFKGAKTINVKKTKKSYTAKKLKARKKYYVRVRAYKNYKDANGKTKKAYGQWVKKTKKTK